jgi:hypothetical protein
MINILERTQRLSTLETTQHTRDDSVAAGAVEVRGGPRSSDHGAAPGTPRDHSWGPAQCSRYGPSGLRTTFCPLVSESDQSFFAKPGNCGPIYELNHPAPFFQNSARSFAAKLQSCATIYRTSFPAVHRQPDQELPGQMIYPKTTNRSRPLRRHSNSTHRRGWLRGTRASQRGTCLCRRRTTPHPSGRSARDCGKQCLLPIASVPLRLIQFHECHTRLLFST